MAERDDEHSFSKSDRFYIVGRADMGGYLVAEIVRYLHYYRLLLLLLLTRFFLGLLE